MINPVDFRDLVIKPTLDYLNDALPIGKTLRNDEHVVDLLLGTAAQESHMGYYLKQITGPALGVYQTEPATHESIWDHFLAFRPELAGAVRGLASQHSFTRSNKLLNNELITNLAYATAIARLVYLPVPDKIPETLEGRAYYWDKHYNKNPDKGFPEEFVRNYKRFISNG